MAVFQRSLGTKVREEIRFRGSAQVPLEKRYGPKAAILIVSLVFVAAHLHQGWLPPIMLQVFFGSILLGILAYKTGSLIPGILAHFVVDIFNFSYWWSDVGGRFTHRPLAETGLDTHFLTWTLLLFAFATLLFFTAVRKAGAAHEQAEKSIGATAPIAPEPTDLSARGRQLYL